MESLNLFSKFNRSDDALKSIISDQSVLLKEASAFIKNIEKGNLNIEISEALSKDDLGASLISMQKYLSNIASSEQERNWLNIGLAKFSDILRNKESQEFKDWVNDILKNMVKYVDANQGGIFTINEEDTLEMVACYAYDRKKYLNKKIEIGEGLTGQCFLEKESIYLTEIPSDYIQITSGLGGATPKAILLTPLMINENVYGVLELASFNDFPDYKKEFINKLSENIASAIKNVKDTERTQLLLNASQQQTEELRAQEEEMRQNMEELNATQEEMQRKNDEIAKNAAEMEGILSAINSTMATIEFTTDGNVLNANDNFLKVMKYSLSEIKGQPHKKFVPKDILETEEYKSFWKSLAGGISKSGTFKRINAEKETVWLNAMYNPIKDASGEVVKVVKFATNITAEQEILAENRGIMAGINSSMATIEFTPEGYVLTANENFMSTMRYSINEIKGEHHRKFVPADVLNSEEYKTFWQNLADGIPNSGIFKRKNKEGKIVWLNAIYNPILNASGDVVKVVKFATDITKEKEREMSFFNSGKIN